MVTGESHYYQGRRYLLDVIEHDAPPTVTPTEQDHDGTPRAGPAPTAPSAMPSSTLVPDRIREQIPALLATWEPRLGVTVNEVRIKKMKTRWGSCNADAKRIWLNLELAKKPRAHAWSTSSSTR
jgi:predicted metal-dependent hydrolase